MRSPRRSTQVVVLASIAVVAVAPATHARRPAAPVAKLAGTVWTDTDGDGVRERGEAGRARVTVRIERRAQRRGRPAWVRVAAPRTSRSGGWSMTIHTAGRHRVTVRRPADASGFAPRDRGSDRADSDVDASGVKTLARVALDGRTRRVDAGLLPARAAGPPAPGPQPPAPPPPTPPPGPSHASGVAWRDRDPDGLRSDAEPLIANAVIEAWSADKTQLLASTTTDASGAWELTVDTAAPYRLKATVSIFNGFSPPFRGADRTRDSDFLRTYPDRGFTAPLAVGVDHADIGTAAIAASGIGDLVWNDRDRDGVYDSRDEVGVAGVTVELWDDTRSELLDVDVTDARGRFSTLAPGGGFSYRLRVLAPAGASFSPKGVGDDLTDSEINPTGPDTGWSGIFFLAPNTINSTTWDAGLYGLP